MISTLPTYREYRLSRGWRIFMCVAVPLLILLFVGMPLLWWLEKPMPLSTALYCMLPLGFALPFLYGLVEAIRGRIIITPESVTQVGSLGRRQLAWVEIKGYRIDKNYLRLLPTDTSKRPVNIGLLTEEVEEIIDWVVEYYPNLSPPTPVIQSAPALIPFASPETQAAPDRHRIEAQQTAQLLSRASWVATAWIIFYPAPYTMAITAGLLLPLGAAGAQWLYPGVLRPDEPDSSPASSLGVPLIVPAVALFIRIMLDAELVNTSAIQPWAYSIGGSFALLLLLGSWKHLVGKDRDTGQLIIIVTAALLYGYSAPVAYNVAFDTGAPTYYNPPLLSKFINTGELSGFKAKVRAWGPFTAPNTLPVSRTHYQRLKPGSRVQLRLMPGQLGIPWFKVIEPAGRN